MLRWTGLFLILALIAALLGFGVIASGFASAARIAFFIFLALLVFSLLVGRRSAG